MRYSLTAHIIQTKNMELLAIIVCCMVVGFPTAYFIIEPEICERLN